MATVAYLGNYRYPFTTETHIANTLERLGHEVIRIQESPEWNADVLMNSLNQKVLDFLLWTRTPDLESSSMGDVLEYCKRRKITTVSYHLDLYVGLKRDGGMDTSPFWRTDYVFTPDGDPYSAEVFKEKGINHHWLKPGVDKSECYIADEPITRDVIFVGSKGYHPEWPYRPKLIEWLQSTYGSRFEHWGSDGLGVVRNDALNRLFASTRVVVGDSLCLPGHTNYWSDRVYETLGRGGFLIMPSIPGLEQELKDGEDLISYEYGDFPELKYLIDYYLQADPERERIRQHGHEKVKKHYTYDERLKEMFDVLGLSPEGKK